MENGYGMMSNQTMTADLIVVGGGIVGLSAAFEAARQGMKVVLLERQQFAGGTTCAAAGMLAPSAEAFIHPSLSLLAWDSLELYQPWVEELWELTGIDPELRLRGVFVPEIEASSANSSRISRREPDLTPINLHKRWLDRSRLANLNIQVGKEVIGGAFYENEGHISPIKLSEALLEGARRLGASCYEHEEVREFIVRDKRISGVKTASKTFLAEHVLLCSGLENEHLARSIGLRMPHYAVKGELLVLRLQTALESVVYGEGVYIVPKSQQRVYIGATSFNHQYDHHVSAGSIVQLLEQACRYLPELRTAAWEQAWAGLRPCTPDQRPYLGPVHELPGLWVASGHYRNGILLAPATASSMIDWIRTGSMPWSYLKDFGLERVNQYAIEMTQ